MQVEIKKEKIMRNQEKGYIQNLDEDYSDDFDKDDSLQEPE